MQHLKILTLSGWTQPIDALDAIAPAAEKLDYLDHTPESVLEHSGQYDVVIGWSLGGVLARMLLASEAISAGALVMIASPYQFVRGGAVQEAMLEDTFEQFYANFRDDTPRTIKRFNGLLLKGDAHAREIQGAFKHHPRIEESALWLRWLAFLRDYSAHEADYSKLPKTLIIHGAQDAIVPVAQAHLLAKKLGAELHILPNAGHAPHYHNAAQVRAVIEAFVAKV